MNVIIGIGNNLICREVIRYQYYQAYIEESILLPCTGVPIIELVTCLVFIGLAISSRYTSVFMCAPMCYNILAMPVYVIATVH